MAIKHVTLDQMIIEFYRKEIRQRYQLDRLHKIKEFDKISDEILEGLRDFVLEHLYPPQEVRDKLDRASADMGELLRSPTRFGPLLFSAWASVLWLGVQLPATVMAGIAVVDTLTELHELETSMMKAASKLKIRIKNADDRAAMLRVIAEVPEATVKSVIQKVMDIFKMFSNVKMLAGVLRVLEHCLSTMEKRHDTFNDGERQGLKLAIEVLRSGYDLFKKIKQEDIPRIIKGIERVELEWYDNTRLSSDAHTRLGGREAPVKRCRLS